MTTPYVSSTHADLVGVAAAALSSAAWSPSGANRFLVAVAGNASAAPADPSGVTHGGVALTKVGSSVSAGPYGKLSAYTLLDPSPAANTTVYSWPSAQDETAAGCVAFADVDQGTPTGPVSTASGNLATNGQPTVTVACAAGDRVVAACWYVDESGNDRVLTASAPASNNYDADVGSYEWIAIASKTAATSSESIAFNIDPGNTGGGGVGDAGVNWAVIGFALKGSAAGGIVDLGGGAFSTVTGSGTLTPDQLAAPIADISAGAWLPSTGVALHPMVGEANADDGTAVWCPVANSAVEFGLASLSDPAVSGGHTLFYRLSSPVGATFQITVKQSATQIAQWTQTSTPALAQYSRTLSAAEADAITDYTNLRVRIEAL